MNRLAIASAARPPVITIPVPRKSTDVTMLTRKRQMVMCGDSGRCAAVLACAACCSKK